MITGVSEIVIQTAATTGVKSRLCETCCACDLPRSSRKEVGLMITLFRYSESTLGAIDEWHLRERGSRMLNTRPNFQNGGFNEKKENIRNGQYCQVHIRIQSCSGAQHASEVV
jgi:hypothetical protein